jgi:hypothetical protein
MPSLAKGINPQPPKPQSNGLADWFMQALQGVGDEAAGAFERYGRRSGAQRDASLQMLNQAVDPNTDPLTGAGMKALGLAGLITHPLAFFPTGDEWRDRLAQSGNTGRLGQAIGGALGDLPGIVDPHLLVGGGALAAAPMIGKLGRGMSNLAGDATQAEMNALRNRLGAEAGQVGGAPNTATRDEALQNLVGGGDEGITAYHGTTEKGLKRLSTRNAIETPGAVFASSRDDVADTFTHPREYGEPVFEDELGNEIARGEVLKLRLSPKNVLTYPQEAAQRFIDDSGLQAKAVREAKSAGHDMIHVKDVMEGIGERYRGDVYVILDDNIISILERYGIPMTVGAGGAMMVAGQDMPPEFANQFGGGT